MAVKNLLTVSFDDETGQYQMSIPQGSNVAETAFCMATVIKCFVRDGYAKSNNEVVDLIKKYLNDPQYDEVEDTTDE